MLPNGKRRKRGQLRIPYIAKHKKKKKKKPATPPPTTEDGGGDGDAKTGRTDSGKEGTDGFFDTKIRLLSTRKDDITQCHAAEHGIIPKHPFRFLLSGASGSGKSTVLINLLKRFYVKDDGRTSYFDKIYAIGPTVKYDDLWKELNLPDEQLIEKPDKDFLENVFAEQEQKIKANGIDKADKVLFAFEDIISHAKFMRSKEFLKAFVMGRHLGCSSMICTQSFTKVPRACRLQCTHLAFFPSSQSEMILMNEEFCPPRMSKKDFHALMSYATTPDERDSHPFLYIDHPAKPADRFRKTFGRKLII